jgi:DNA-directed RNA polymerase subunit RPC12/RpoP
MSRVNSKSAWLENYCPHCSTKVSRQVRKLLLLYGEARCPWCGYMLVPRITSLLPLKAVVGLAMGAVVNLSLKYFFSATPHFFILLATSFAVYIGLRLCDCYASLRAFDV